MIWFDRYLEKSSHLKVYFTPNTQNFILWWIQSIKEAVLHPKCGSDSNTAKIDSTDSQWVIAGLLLLNPIKTLNALTEQGQWSVACGHPFCNLSWGLGCERGACLLKTCLGANPDHLPPPPFYAHRGSLHDKQRPCNNEITKNLQMIFKKISKTPFKAKL